MSKTAWRIAGIAIVVVLSVMSCAAPAAPSPTATPAKATSGSAPGAAKTGDTSAAKSSAPSEAKSASSSNWKADWDKMVAAAKSEGKVVVAGAPGDLYRNAMMEFQKTYPDIQVEFTGVQGGDFAPKILAERDGGKYLWDVHLGGWNTPLIMLKPKGAFDPVKPALLLPEVLDNAKWLGGLDASWVDKELQYEFAFTGRLTFFGYVNRDAVPESQLSSVDQLLDPKWKGKISSQDPRVTGPFSSFMGYLLSVKGEDFVRKLLSQDLVIMKGGREQVEALVRGKNPIGLGVNAADVEAFTREGLAATVKPLAPDEPAGRRVSSGFGNLMLVNKAPHPNAAKVFANWILSKDGQKAYVAATGLNSRRLDIDGPPETAPNPNVKYEVNETETSPLLTNTGKAIEIAKELIK